MTRLTGNLRTLIGTNARNAYVEVEAPAAKVGNSLYAEGGRIPFNPDGTLQERDLVATDTEGLDPAFWYGFTVVWDGGELPTTYGPVTGETVDLAEIVALDPVDPAYVPRDIEGMIAAALAAGNFATVAQLLVALAAKADLVNGVIPTSQIPAVALTTGQAVINRAAMLALTNVQAGDFVSITSGADKGTYILTDSGPSTSFSSWLPCSVPTDVVQTVNGKNGVVVLGPADVGAASQAELAARLALPNFTPVSGSYYLSSPATSTSGNLGNGTIRVIPWYCPVDLSIGRIGGEIVTAGEAGSSLRPLVFADNGQGRPGALLLDGGPLNGAAVGVPDNAVDFTLPKGWLWVGGVVQGAPTTQPVVRTTAAAGTPSYFMAEVGYAMAANASAGAYSWSGQTGPITGPWAGTGTGISAAPRIHFKVK